MSEKVYGTCSAPKRTKKFFAPKISLYRGVPHQEKISADPLFWDPTTAMGFFSRTVSEGSQNESRLGSNRDPNRDHFG